MRNPASGTGFDSAERIQSISSRVTMEKGSLQFSRSPYAESAGGTYFAYGTTDSVGISSAIDGDKTLFIYSKASHYQTGLFAPATEGDDRIMFALVDDVNAIPNYTATLLQIARGTRPGVCRLDDNVFVVAFVGIDNMLYVTTVNGAGVLVSAGEGIPIADMFDTTGHQILGMAVSPIDRDRIWFTYLADGHLIAKLWIVGQGIASTFWLTSNPAWVEQSVPSDVVMPTDRYSAWWEVMSSRIIESPFWPTKYIIFYQHADGFSASRTVSADDILGDYVGMMGHSKDYSFQYIRIVDVAVVGESLVSVVQRGIWDSQDLVSTWMTTLARSIDGRTWADIAYVSNGKYKASVGIVAGNVVVMDEGNAFISDGCHGIGSSEEIEVPNAMGWTYECAGPGAASIGKTKIAVSPTIPDVDHTYIIRRYYTVNGSEYLISTEFSDNTRSMVTGSETEKDIVSRGPIKLGIEAISSVDELFDSGTIDTRYLGLHSVVGKRGAWLSHEDDSNGYISVDSVPDDGSVLPAVCIVTEPVSNDSFSMNTRIISGWVSGGEGIVFWWEDEENYWEFSNVSAGNLHVSRVQGGVRTPIDGWAIPSGTVSEIMVYRHGSYVSFYINATAAVATYAASSDVGSTYAKNQSPCDQDWTYLGYVHVMTEIPEKSYIGLCGPVGTQFRVYSARVGNVALTLGRISEIVGRRSGMDMTVGSELSYVHGESDPATLIGDYTDMGGTSVVSTTGISLDKYMWSGVDLDAVVGIGAGEYIEFLFGCNTKDNAPWGSGGAVVRVDPVNISVYVIYNDGVSVQQNMVYRLPHPYPGLEGPFTLRVATLTDLYGASSTVHVDVAGARRLTAPLGFMTTPGYPGFRGTGKVYSLDYKGVTDLVDAHIWQGGRPAIDEIKSILEPHLVFVLERSDGTVMAKPFDVYGDDLGSLDMTTEKVEDARKVSWNSAYKIVGAEVFSVYVDEELAKIYGVRISDIDMPYLWTESECAKFGGRYANLARSQHRQLRVGGFLDPRVESNDTHFSLSNQYVVDNYSMSVSNLRSPKGMITIASRKRG